MKEVPDFTPALEADYPEIKEKKLWEILAPIQKALKDLVGMAQGQVGGDNLNEEVLQVELIPTTWNTIELKTLKGGTPRGAYPILVDNPGGRMTGWGCELVDESRIKVRIDLVDVNGTAITQGKYTVRILVKGA
jgi:hypothetical protein